MANERYGFYFISLYCWSNQGLFPYWVWRALISRIIFGGLRCEWTHHFRSFRREKKSREIRKKVSNFYFNLNFRHYFDVVECVRPNINMNNSFNYIIKWDNAWFYCLWSKLTHSLWSRALKWILKREDDRAANCQLEIAFILASSHLKSVKFIYFLHLKFLILRSDERRKWNFERAFLTVNSMANGDTPSMRIAKFSSPWNATNNSFQIVIRIDLRLVWNQLVSILAHLHGDFDSWLIFQHLSRNRHSFDAIWLRYNSFSCNT